MNTFTKAKSREKGFTLIEILIVIGIIAILATVVLVALNPARQFAQARNSQRTSNVNAILNAIGQNIADNKGTFTCAAGVIPTSATNMEKTGGYDVRPCIVSTYISEIPIDPSSGSNTCNSDCSTGSYDSGYSVERDATSGRLTVKAPSTELGGAMISVTR